jgi:hypothetical protein
MPDAPEKPPGGPAPAGPPLVGTDALGRPFTDAERLAAEELLGKHGFAGLFIVALAFGLKLTGNRGRAEDIRSRAFERLLRTGWDPAEIPLKGRINRLVDSEWTHELAERRIQREAEQRFVDEMQRVKNRHTQSGDERDAAREKQDRSRAGYEERLAKLERAFTEADDTVNLEWLAHWRAGVRSLAEMARRSQRDPKEFYRATDRRKRHMRRLLGVDDDRILEEDP